MNRNHQLGALLFAMSSGLVGCATPSPIVRLHPRGGDVVWVSGRAVVAQEQTGVRVATAFERQERDALGIRVEVENGTEQRLEVNPRDVTFSACASEKTSSCSASRHVVDPERAIDALDFKRSMEAASSANEQAFLGTLLMLNAITDVASLASGHPDRETGLRTAAAADEMHNEAARHGGFQMSVASERQVWSDVALRRTSLFPGRGLSGYVYVPIDLTARYIWLQVRAGPRVFPFWFQQVVTPVATPAGRRARTDMGHGD